MIAAWIITIAAAATLVAAWWQPGSPGCAILGWTSALLWCASLAIPSARLKRMYVGGCLIYAGGFYWLYTTIKEFGGFPSIAALAVYALFVFGSAVQFLFWAYLYTHAPKFIQRAGLTTALSWLAAYHFWIKIFPWDFAHTQLAFLPYIQAADIGGVTLLTFLMLWVSECLVRRKAIAVSGHALAGVALLATLAYGWWRLDWLPSALGTPLRIVMIQGNVSIEHKQNISMIVVNRDHYMQVSRQVAEPDSLVIWPESTITRFVHDQIEHADFSPLLPHLDNGSAFLVGGLTAKGNEYYNSSILIRPDGSVPQPYHKMILMPFGEYTPFGSIFPWLMQINATAGQFTPGEEIGVLEYNLSDGTPVRLSPLICYEDVIPAPAQEAARKGAQLLINQTNDAWFGDTVAPYQHHLIAAFRAIETRKFLLRSTNTGLTAVVDPAGRTLASLLPFSEGTLPWEVNLMNEQTFYANYPVRTGWLILSLLYVVAIIRVIVGRRN